ncbi:MAG: RecX family transcriptional regulator [Phocaeicola vulgatus]|nr:RecX family transcriptional regulator [Phocaeicola vulgatus]
MKIKESDTNELLMIANNVTGEYSEKGVRQAKEELYRRGVDDKVIADIMEEKEEAFMRRLDAAARAEKARMDKQNEKNRNVSYRWWELIPMLLFAPFYLVRGEKELVDILGLFPELRRLKEEKYDLKFKQRLTALIAGDAMYFLLIYYSLLNDEVL